MLALYLSILSVGFFITAYAKKWHVLPIISFLFVIFYYTSTLEGILTFNQTILFIIVIGIVYSLLPYLYALVYKPKKRFIDSLLILLSGYYIFIQLYSHLSHSNGILSLILIGGDKMILKYLLLFFGTIYLSAYAILYLKDKTNEYLLATLGALFSMCYASTIIVHFGHSYNTIMGLSILGLVLLTAGLYISTLHLRIYAYLIWIVANLGLISRYTYPTHGTSLTFNSIHLCIAINTCIFACAAYLAYILKKQLTEQEELAPEILASSALLTIFYWFNTNAFSSPYHIVGMVGYAMILFIIGIFKYSALRYFAYAFWVGALAHFGFIFIEKNLLQPQHALQLNLLHALFVGTCIIIYYLSYSFTKYFEKDEESILSQTLSFLIGLLCLNWGRSNIVLRYKEFGIATYNNTLNVALTIFYGLYSLILITIGLFKREPLLRYLGLAIVILTLNKLWFIIMAMSDTIYRIVTFIVIGVLLLIASIAYQQLSKRTTK